MILESFSRAFLPMTSMSSLLVGTGFTIAHIAVSLAGIVLIYGIYKISAFIHDEVTSPIRDVPGPPNPSFLYGNFNELTASVSNDSGFLERWLDQYGPTIEFKTFLSSSRLLTTDLKAINYMLFNYPKPTLTGFENRKLFGNGIVFVEGDVHKHQRKILNPAFAPQPIRELADLFVEKALELRDIWRTEIAKHDGVGPIECLSWMSRTTIDIIGLAGFNYNFNALSGDLEKNELLKSFSTLFKSGGKPSIIPLLKAMYSPLRFLTAPNDAERNKASAVMNRIGTDLLNQSRASHGENKSSGRKDILSLLVQANAMEDLAGRMTDENVLDQIPTFIIAGHETTSIAMTWALYALSQNKQAQTKLRQEVSDVFTDNPTTEDLNGLPYLDAVVRETMRRYSPVPVITRAAPKDDFIPLSKPFTDRKGNVRHEIRVRKGQTIFIPISLVNKDKSIWGDDSNEFKPERWTSIPDVAQSVPGIWANVMTFAGGPRACIGFRFSLLEMKVLLFTLIRAFEFDLGVSAKDVGTTAIANRPVLLTDPESSNQMPLVVRPIS